MGVQTVEEGMAGLLAEDLKGKRTLGQRCQGVSLLQKGHKVLKDFVCAAVCRLSVGKHVLGLAGREQQGIETAEKQGVTAKVRVLMTEIR